VQDQLLEIVFIPQADLLSRSANLIYVALVRIGFSPYSCCDCLLSFDNCQMIRTVHTKARQPVPRPGTMALFALGLVTLGAARRRKVQA
jgi:hypothetical protein